MRSGAGEGEGEDKSKEMMNVKNIILLGCLIILLFLTGCQTYEITITDVIIEEPVNMTVGEMSYKCKAVTTNDCTQFLEFFADY